MTLLSIMKLLPRTSFVNTNHSHTNGPSSFSNGEAKITVVGIDVAAFLKGINNLDYGFQKVVGHIIIFHLSEELFC